MIAVDDVLKALNDQLELARAQVAKLEQAHAAIAGLVESTKPARRQSPRGPRATSPQRTTATPSPTTSRPQVCGNCGKPGHNARGCEGPKVAKEPKVDTTKKPFAQKGLSRRVAQAKVNAIAGRALAVCLECDTKVLDVVAQKLAHLKRCDPEAATTATELSVHQYFERAKAVAA